MSELNAHYESDAVENDETTIEAVLAAHDEAYNPELRPAHLDPVFDRIRMEQIKLSERSFSSIDEAQAYVIEIINQFQQECAEKQIIPRNVRITGAGITVPRQDNDPFSGASMTTMVSVDQVETALPLVVKQQGIDGTFMGVWYQLIRLEDSGEDESDAIPCQARLRYLVGVKDAPHLNGFNYLAATGDVLTTELEFTSDRRLRELGTIYDTLVDHASLQTERHVDKLLALLSQYDNFAPSTLKVVSNLVDLITRSEEFIDNVVKKDALEELLRFYISMRPTYALMVPDELEKTEQGYIPRTMTKSDEPICYDQKLASIILAPRYYKREGAFVLCPDKSVPYFVAVGEDKKVHYLPMGRMIGFYARD